MLETDPQQCIHALRRNFSLLPLPPYTPSNSPFASFLSIALWACASHCSSGRLKNAPLASHASQKGGHHSCMFYHQYLHFSVTSSKSISYDILVPLLPFQTVPVQSYAHIYLFTTEMEGSVYITSWSFSLFS